MKTLLEKKRPQKTSGTSGTFDPEFWRDRFPSEPYTVDSDNFEDYEPAYRLGYDLRGVIGDFDLHEDDIHARWDSAKGKSRLDWDRVKDAVRSAWEDNTTVPRTETDPSSAD
ncbi:MAG TPA: hypothetical protein VG796_10560 [Verrucomicrobiales bacterium]|jgi:hypothetical protein|nr:hypothetical protein [Verrucomicrobiales bacterium]